MSDLDPAAIPAGPLSMAGLLSLEPAPLRRLLKGGLRQGLAPAELEQLLRRDLQLDLAQPAAQALLLALEQRGWFRFDQDRGRWRTHLGQSAA